MLKIIHKRSNCTGCGICAAICPELFELSEKDGLAILKNSLKKNDDYELEVKETDSVKMVIDACPAQAVLIKED